MPETYLKQSVLAHLGLAARTGEDPATAGVRLGELPFQVQVGVRGDAEDEAFRAAVKAATGENLPLCPCTAMGPKENTADGLRILWMGPDEWLVVAPEAGNEDLRARLTNALADQHAAVWDVSGSRTVITLSGPNARDVLMKGCPLDVHASAFKAREVKGSSLGLAHVTLHQTSDAPEYHIYVHRSFAEYLWAWLEDAAGEYGIGIEA